ncbi:MAG: hypothetical protein EPN97_03490 [Alphaproteobacteria bacterium]|nr:MAG: hypothetical protein EPN97_03490 [Alphaproteobacteria bacterium]
MKRIEFFAVLVVLAALPFSQAWSDKMVESPLKQAMTVDEAYKAIPHNKTRFDASAAGMVQEEKAFLDTFFELSDLAVAERVGTQISLSSGKPTAANYDVILRRLQSLNVPPKLAEAHRLVTEAVKEQREYLDALKGGGAFDANAPLVESSHQKLVQAYNELMRLYPSENTHNKQAFFDHLCALDFK